ncbi:MAG: hypothetical protein KBS66_04015 [Eubacterium sp.]|nr:hypothetical protein [Candidatus Colimonas fimequi]
MTDNKKIYVTDGTDIEAKIDELKAEGYTDVTISINTLHHTKYNHTNDGKHLQDVIDGINIAAKNKLGIRLDVSITEGLSDDEVLDFLQLTFQHNFDIVFMPTISYDFLKSKMPALRQIPGEFDGIDFYKYPGAIGRIGFILN